MKKRFPDRIPDLKLPPWRKTRLYILKAESGETVGDYCEYIHEQTSKYGVEIRITGSLDKVIIWEEAMFINGKETSVRHIAYTEKFTWRKVRVKNMYPSRTEMENSSGRRNINVYFLLVINGEVRIPFSVKS